MAVLSPIVINWKIILYNKWMKNNFTFLCAILYQMLNISAKCFCNKFVLILLYEIPIFILYNNYYMQSFADSMTVFNEFNEFIVWEKSHIKNRMKNFFHSIFIHSFIFSYMHSVCLVVNYLIHKILIYYYLEHTICILKMKAKPTVLSER